MACSLIRVRGARSSGMRRVGMALRPTVDELFESVAHLKTTAAHGSHWFDIEPELPQETTDKATRGELMAEKGVLLWPLLRRDHWALLGDQSGAGHCSVVGSAGVLQ